MSASIVMAAAVSGCGTDTSMLGPDSSIANAAVAPQGTVSRPILRTVSYRPALGPPDDVGSELSKQLNDIATEQGLALVIDPKFQADVTLRGYVSAMRKGPNVNITYLWDVVDSRGQRVHRISGEEALANGVDVKQPWAAVTPAVSRMIALKTMEDLGRWARSAQPQTAGGIAPPPPAGAGASSLSIAPAGGR